MSAWNRRSESKRRPPGHVTVSSRIFALPPCGYGPELQRHPNGGRFAALCHLGRVVGFEERSPIGDGRRARGRGGVLPRNGTTRHPGVEERRRVEEQEDDQSHGKDPGFARPITLAPASSSRAGVLCEHFARFSSSRPGRAGAAMLGFASGGGSSG